MGNSIAAPPLVYRRQVGADSINALPIAAILTTIAGRVAGAAVCRADLGVDTALTAEHGARAASELADACAADLSVAARTIAGAAVSGVVIPVDAST